MSRRQKTGYHPYLPILGSSKKKKTLCGSINIGLNSYAHTALRPLLFCLGLALAAAYLRCNKSEGCSPTPAPSLHKSQDSANEVSLIMDKKKGPCRAGTSQTTIKRIIKNNNRPKGRKKRVILFIHGCVCAYIYIHISHNI